MPRKSAARVKLEAKTARVVERLVELYPEPRCALIHSNAFQLLTATILSAQCTDAMVNRVTPALFERFPNPRELSEATVEEVEGFIKSTGFYHNKAKNLVAMARAVVETHDGEVPTDLDALTELPGVGRKTAHVVLGTWFRIASGVVVDTHVKRLSHRIGLTTRTDPVLVERDLVELVPREHWIDFSHRLIEHGRKVCDARKPRCEACSLLDLCARAGLEPPNAPPSPARRGRNRDVEPPATGSRTL